MYNPYNFKKFKYNRHYQLKKIFPVLDKMILCHIFLHIFLPRDIVILICLLINEIRPNIQFVCDNTMPSNWIWDYWNKTYVSSFVIQDKLFLWNHLTLETVYITNNVKTITDNRHGSIIIVDKYDNFFICNKKTHKIEKLNYGVIKYYFKKCGLLSIKNIIAFNFGFFILTECGYVLKYTYEKSNINFIGYDIIKMKLIDNDIIMYTIIYERTKMYLLSKNFGEYIGIQKIKPICFWVPGKKSYTDELWNLDFCQIFHVRDNYNYHLVNRTNADGQNLIKSNEFNLTDYYREPSFPGVNNYVLINECRWLINIFLAAFKSLSLSYSQYLHLNSLSEFFFVNNPHFPHVLLV